MKHIGLFAIALWSAVPFSAAASDMFAPDVLQQMQGADVVFMGEVHDNPLHHERQAKAIDLLQPKAVVWEMLLQITADRINAGWLDDADNLDEMIAWAQEHWPNFELYRPVLKVSEGIDVYGGLVTRAQTREALEIGADVAFGVDAAQYGLGVSLTNEEQEARETLQFEAHCEAIPEDMLPGLVEIQRLRDATLARAVVQAMEDTGGPVMVITGNGHARTDWGAPYYLDHVARGLRVFSVGQSEEGRSEGTFDVVLDGPAVERPDPCAAFRKTSSD